MRLIYIDDQELELKTLKHAFESIKQAEESLLTFKSGYDFLSWLDIMSNQTQLQTRQSLSLSSVACILLDLNLSGLSGIEVMEVLRNSPHPLIQKLPIYIFTSSWRPKDEDAALKSGANGFLTKPMEYKDLQNMLTSLLNKHSRNLTQLEYYQETSYD